MRHANACLAINHSQNANFVRPRERNQITGRALHNLPDSLASNELLFAQIQSVRRLFLPIVHFVPLFGFRRLVAISCSFFLLITNSFVFRFCFRFFFAFLFLSRHDNPLPTFAWPYRQLSLLVVWLLNIRQLIYPASLSCDWSASSVQLVSSLNDIRKICPSALFCALFAALLLKHWQHKTLRFVSSFSFLPFAIKFNSVTVRYNRKH